MQLLQMVLKHYCIVRLLSPHKMIIRQHPLEYLDMSSAAHFAIHAITNESYCNLCPMPCSNWCRNTLVFSHIRLMAFSARPWHSDSPTGLFTGMIAFGLADCMTSCNLVMDGSWSVFNIILIYFKPALSQSWINRLGAQCDSSWHPLFGTWCAQHVPYLCSTTTKYGGLNLTSLFVFHSIA